MHKTRVSLPIAATLLASAAFCLPARAAEPVVERRHTTQEFLDHWTQFFENFDHRNPDVRRGSGFMAFNRYKDYITRRFPNLAEMGGDPPAGLGLRADRELVAMEEALGRTGGTWFNIGPVNFSGRCLAIQVDPTNSNTVYAGFASGGVWKTVDGGTTWTPLGDQLPSMAVGAVEVDALNPDHVWVGTGEGWGNVDAISGVGVYESFDGGATWSPTPLSWAITDGRDIPAIEQNPTTGTLLVGGPSLWRSTDSGASFTELYAGGTWGAIERKPGSATTWYATNRGSANVGFWRSTDDGATWTLVGTGGPALVMGNRLAVSAADPNLIYWSSTQAANTMGIWKSTNSGDTFTQVFSGNHYGAQGWYNFTLSCGQSNANLVYSGGVEFYRSTNGGTSFSIWSGAMHVDHHAQNIDPSNGNNLWIGSDGGVWKSTNAGSNFIDCNNGLVTSQFYAMASSRVLPTRAMGGTQDNGTWIYANSTNWSKVIGGDGFQCEVDWLNPDNMYGELYYGDHRASTNGGANFAARNSGIGFDGPWETPTWLDLADPNWLWAGHNQNLYRSTNKMVNWAAVAGHAPSGQSRSISQSPVDTNIMADAHVGTVYISTDHGVTFTPRTNGLVAGGTISDVTFHPTDANTVYCTCSSYSTTTVHQIYQTTDLGLNWTAIDAGLPDEPLNTVEVHPDHPSWIFVGSDSAVYVSFDGGATWQPLNNGLPHVQVDDLRIHPADNFLRIGTYGRGMWELDITDLSPTAVGQTQPIESLALRVLGNPANTRTRLHFGVRTAGNVSLGIFDAQGRKVLNVRDGHMLPMVDDADVDLSTLAAGVYFARLQQGGLSVTRKIVIER